MHARDPSESLRQDERPICLHRRKPQRAAARIAALAVALLGLSGCATAGMLCLSRCGGSDRPILAPVVGIGIGSAVGGVVGVFRAPARWVEVRIR